MTLPLPPGEFAAYLFDCDGTIVDSMPLHYVAWQRALNEWGCEFPEDLFYAWGGRPTADIIVALNEQQGLSMPVATVVERRETYYEELLPQLAAVPEVLAHIHDAHRRVPFAVVSGSTRASVTASSTRSVCWTGSTCWSAPTTTRGPSPTRRHSCSRRNTSA